jgi:hypothetical protein
MGSKSSPSMPETPDPSGAYADGIEAYVDAVPDIAKADYKAKLKYFPKVAEMQSQLYAKYLPQYTDTNLLALNQADPYFIPTNNALGKAVNADLAYGKRLDPDLAREVNQGIRGAQTARGNSFGNAPISAEALNRGSRALELYQSRLNNAMNYMRGPRPQSQFSALQGGASPMVSTLVQAAQPGQYANVGQAMAVGGQMSNYWQGMAQNAGGGASATTINPWAGAATGALTGAASGAMVGTSFGPVGTVVGGAVGAIAGGAAGYFGAAS